jgi:hypothetical protein
LLNHRTKEEPPDASEAIDADSSSATPARTERYSRFAFEVIAHIKGVTKQHQS